MSTTASANAAFPSGRFRFIKRRDYALMHRIHHWQPPEWVRPVMVCVTRCGDGWLWYALGLGILIDGGPQRVAVVMSGLVSCGTGLGIYCVVKRTTRRMRPCLVEPSLWANTSPPDQYSFPSGHAIASFAIATSVGLSYPVLLPALLVCAFLISLSRILLGLHFLSDVLAGILLGACLGCCAFYLIA